MKWAVTPRGVGQQPGFRAIDERHSLENGETFTVERDSVEGLVLGPNGRTLVEGAPPEPTLDEIYDQLAQSQRLVRALVSALNDGTFVPGQNYNAAQIKSRIRSKL